MLTYTREVDMRKTSTLLFIAIAATIVAVRSLITHFTHWPNLARFAASSVPAALSRSLSPNVQQINHSLRNPAGLLFFLFLTCLLFCTVGALEDHWNDQ